jgi:hypothetical protein
MISNILRAGVLDGSWSVTFYTRSSVYHAASRSGVIIQNGFVYPEAGGINFNGRVSPNGTVRASVSAGDQNASGSGRRGRSSGGGLWRGQGSRGACSGSWAAERRG